MVRRLTSENIVHFIETGTSGGRDYEVMDYLPGGNLSRFAATGDRGALPAHEVTEIVRQVAAGLEELHRTGHRAP